MNMNKTGGPAFPASVEPGTSTRDDVWLHEGMTLRDYFAAAALPKLIQMCVGDTRGALSYEDYVAKEAYGMADAMLKARAS